MARSIFMSSTNPIVLATVEGILATFHGVVGLNQHPQLRLDGYSRFQSQTPNLTESAFNARMGKNAIFSMPVDQKMLKKFENTLTGTPVYIALAEVQSITAKLFNARMKDIHIKTPAIPLLVHGGVRPVIAQPPVVDLSPKKPEAQQVQHSLKNAIITIDPSTKLNESRIDLAPVSLKGTFFYIPEGENPNSLIRQYDEKPIELTTTMPNHLIQLYLDRGQSPKFPKLDITQDGVAHDPRPANKFPSAHAATHLNLDMF